jgi:hypothetical protein
MSPREIEGVPERRKTIHKEVKKNPSLYCCDRIAKRNEYIRQLMKMKRMTKQELIDSITEYETLLNNKAKIRKFKNFTIGAFIVHLAKLKQELKTRG